MAISPGKRLGRYEVRSQIGAGGMGEVYLAQDTKLDRQVALKVLPAEVAVKQERMRRFVQEAKAASALNHPNIITIYEIEQIDSVNFIATEFIDGETLRERMRKSPLKLGETLDVAAQIVSALAAAHTAGIVHRDIKPENIMLRADGIVKVLDFGVAKLTERLPPESVDSEAPTSFKTDPGTVIGTAVYMSPEQARGFEVDMRTDIFSLGVLIYEMIAGRLPFEGSSTIEILASILSDKEPSPLARYAREVPTELERIVSKALRKDREVRYQTIKDLLIDLKGVKQELEFEARLELKSRREVSGLRAARDGEPVGFETAQAEAAPTGKSNAVPTISSTKILLGEIKRHQLGVALTLAALVIAAIALFFYFHRQPALTDKDTILLTDWVNTTGDAVFDGTLKQALAVQLGQSPFLNIFGDDRVREALRFMGRSPDERVTRDIGREICQRQGLKALLAGSISGLGSHYVITLEAINAQSGDAIAREQAEAENKEQVLKKLGEAATKLREELGESLASIQKFDAPIEQVTTSSLEALKAFSMGAEQFSKGNYLGSIPLFRRATEIDPNFAYAYTFLSAAYGNTGQTDQAADAGAKAFELRDRASEHEKFAISSLYYGNATREADKRLEVDELWQRTYPRDDRAYTQLAIDYNRLGLFEKAIAVVREGIRLNPNVAYHRSNLANSFIRLNRFDEAKEIYQQALAQKLDAAGFHAGLYSIAFIKGDAEAMKQQVEWAKGRTNEYVAQEWQASSAEFSGQLRKGVEFEDRAVELAQRHDFKDVTAEDLSVEAVSQAAFGDCKHIDELTGKAFAIGRSWQTLINAGRAFALCGKESQAQSVINELTKRFPKDSLLNAIWLPVIRAQMEIRRGNNEEVIQLLQSAYKYEAPGSLVPQYLRGQAYLNLKKGNEAAAEFQMILDHRGWAALSYYYPLACVGLARAAVLQGDTVKARKAYQDFFAQWKDADPDIPILIEAKKEYEKLK